MRKDLYFKELGIVLSRSEFTALPEQDSFLPVVYEGRPLCRVDATGSVFYHQDREVDGPMAGDLCKAHGKALHLLQL